MAARVDGIALGSAATSPGWSVFASTPIRQRSAQRVSEFCRENPSVACSIRRHPDPQSIRAPDAETLGQPVTTYRLPFGLQVGYGFTYQGRFATFQRTALQRVQYFAPDYLVHRFFMSYEIRQGLTAQLNVTNFTNERYFTGIRNNVNATTGIITGGWAVPGEGRSAVLSLFYSS